MCPVWPIGVGTQVLRRNVQVRPRLREEGARSEGSDALHPQVETVEGAAAVVDGVLVGLDVGRRVTA